MDIKVVFFLSVTHNPMINIPDNITLCTWDRGGWLCVRAVYAMEDYSFKRGPSEV